MFTFYNNPLTFLPSQLSFEKSQEKSEWESGSVPADNQLGYST